MRLKKIKETFKDTDSALLSTVQQKNLLIFYFRIISNKSIHLFLANEEYTILQEQTNNKIAVAAIMAYLVLRN